MDTGLEQSWDKSSGIKEQWIAEKWLRDCEFVEMFKVVLYGNATS